MGARWHSALLLAAASNLASCGPDDVVAPARPRPLLVVAVTTRTEDVFGPFAGSIEPRFSTGQGFRTSGRMLGREANVGDLVRRGQPLARLDDTLLRLALTQARADVANAEAVLKNAAASNARKQILVRGETVSRAEADTASADQKTARARLDQALAARDKAESNLGYATLLAEFDAVVIRWNVEVGQEVSEGTSAVTLARPDVREAVIDIPDGLIANVSAGQRYEVTLQAGEAPSTVGVVREIAPGSDGSTRTRRVRFTLVAPSDAFRIGSTVTVSLHAPIEPRMEMPGRAIVERDGRAFAWVVREGGDRVASKPLEVVSRAPDVAIVKGLGAADRVAVAGLSSLRDDMPVRPRLVER